MIECAHACVSGMFIRMLTRDYCHQMLEAKGVKFHLNTGVKEFLGDDNDSVRIYTKGFVLTLAACLCA